MHKAKYTDKIVIRYKKITRLVHATWQGKNTKIPLELDVLQENEDLITKCRNVVYTRLGGYGIIFPNEKVSYYGYGGMTDRYPLDPYGLTEDNGKKRLPLFCSNDSSQKDFETVLSKYPDFQKVLDTKEIYSNVAIMDALYYWKKDKENFVLLLKKKLYSLAFTDSFYNFPKAKKDEIISFIKNCPYELPNVDASKFYKTISLMKNHTDYDFKTMFRVNFGMEVKKSESLDFFKKTKEYSLLSESEQKDFDSYFLKDFSYRLSNFSYAKFRSLVKDKLKYPQTSYSDLMDIKYDDMPKDEYIKFLNFYNKDFSYTIEKAKKCFKNFTLDTVKEVYKLWKKYPTEIEGLCALKLSHLALNEDYYKKSADYKKKALRFFLKEKQFIYLHSTIDLNTLDVLLDHYHENIDFEILQYIFYNKFYVKDLDEKQIKYIYQNKIEADEYASYIKDCVKLNHDLTDKFWKFPNDFEKRHEKIKEEMDNYRKWEKENEGVLYTQAVQNYIKKNPLLKVDGYEIFIPETIEEIQKQADMLKQCLISNNYPQKVIDSDCVLVFLQKDGEPIATCELNEKRIVQFRQKGNGCVTDEMEKAMHKWLAKADFKKEKVIQKVA